LGLEIQDRRVDSSRTPEKVRVGQDSTFTMKEPKVEKSEEESKKKPEEKSGKRKAKAKNQSF